MKKANEWSVVMLLSVLAAFVVSSCAEDTSVIFRSEWNDQGIALDEYTDPFCKCEEEIIFQIYDSSGALEYEEVKKLSTDRAGHCMDLAFSLPKMEVDKTYSAEIFIEKKGERLIEGTKTFKVKEGENNEISVQMDFTRNLFGIYKIDKDMDRHIDERFLCFEARKKDCNDANPLIHSGMIENCEDNIDNDCDGHRDCGDIECRIYYDTFEEFCETDMPGPCESGIKRCIGDTEESPACVADKLPSLEICDNEIDDDCDAAIDAEDADCWGCVPGEDRVCIAQEAQGECRFGSQVCSQEGVWGECNPGSGTDEVCGDGLDNDCDGDIDRNDEDCWDCTPGDTQVCETGIPGRCAMGKEICIEYGYFSDCVLDEDHQPIEEICDNGIDDDCDGLEDTADPSCRECSQGEDHDCYTGLPGVCAEGSQDCDEGFWGECNPEVEIGEYTEYCDDLLDNDCNGLTDAADPYCWECKTPGETENCDTERPGVCAEGEKRCIYGEWSDCIQKYPAVEESDLFLCHDGQDNNCDGNADCLDQKCIDLLLTIENTDYLCHDGIDNDCDGNTDCEDIGDVDDCSPFCQP